MRRRVENLKEIEALYKEGKISKTSYWRAKKRGWCWVDYHKKALNPKNPIIEENIELLLGVAYKNAFRFCRLYLKDGFVDNTETIGADIAQEAIAYVIEVQPKGDIKRLIGIIKNKIKEYATRKRIYYIYFRVEKIEKEMP